MFVILHAKIAGNKFSTFNSSVEWLGITKYDIKAKRIAILTQFPC